VERGGLRILAIGGDLGFGRHLKKAPEKAKRRKELAFVPSGVS